MDNLDDSENRLLFEFKMQPSELDGLPFWKFISLVNYIKETDKSKEDANAEETKQSKDIQNGGIGKTMKQMQKNIKMPKMPKM